MFIVYIGIPLHERLTYILNTIGGLHQIHLASKSMIYRFIIYIARHRYRGYRVLIYDTSYHFKKCQYNGINGHVCTAIKVKVTSKYPNIYLCRNAICRFCFLLFRGRIMLFVRLNGFSFQNFYVFYG